MNSRLQRAFAFSFHIPSSVDEIDESRLSVFHQEEGENSPPKLGKNRVRASERPSARDRVARCPRGKRARL